MGKTNYNEIKVAAARTALFNNIKDVQEEINIHDVLKLSSGENLPTHKMFDGNYPVFGGGGETGLTHNIFNVDFETLAIGRVGARCGCVFKVPKKSWVTDNALYALSFDKRFLLDFLIHYLSYVDLNQYANRAAQPVISLKRISSIKFPLIDIEKQKAIIEIIEQVENGETHFGEEYSELNNALKSVDRINELQDELSHQLTLVSQLEQAILQEAAQGKLVSQDPKDEPASELLKRIKAEKATLRQAQGKEKKEKPLPPIKPKEIPFEIPENWVWCRLGEICSKVTDGFHHTPKKLKEGKIYISATHIRENGIKWNECLFISESDHNELYKKASPLKGEILITNRGAGCGTPVIIDIEEEFSFQNAALIGFNQELIFNKYLFYFILKSRSEIMETFVNGGLQPMLSNVVLSTIPIPLPPLAEQKRIVAEIEKQFAKTKQLKEHIIANQQATEQLLKALLHQAFLPAEAAAQAGEVEEKEEVNR